MNFDEALALVRSAKTSFDLFGAEEDAASRYRKLTKILHPDVAPAGRTDEASDTFAIVTKFWHQRTYAVVSKVGSYTFTSIVGRDSLSDFYSARAQGSDEPLLARITARPSNNDLLRNENVVLAQLVKKIDAKLQDYFPDLKASFPYRNEKTGADHHVNIFGHKHMELVSLSNIMTVFPDGLDWKHVAWIWRRILVALGATHRAGFVYGAVLPDKILIHPEFHGLVLNDWCYSVPTGSRLTAVSSQYRDWYEPNVLKRRPVSAFTDIYMCSIMVMELLDGNVSPSLKNFAMQYTNESSIGTSDAWTVLKRLDDVLEQIAGPRRFTKFPDLPPGTPLWPTGSKGV